MMRVVRATLWLGVAQRNKSFQGWPALVKCELLTLFSMVGLFLALTAVNEIACKVKNYFQQNFQLPHPYPKQQSKVLLKWNEQKRGEIWVHVIKELKKSKKLPGPRGYAA
jgi:hypothetical protein